LSDGSVRSNSAIRRLPGDNSGSQSCSVSTRSLYVVIPSTDQSFTVRIIFDGPMLAASNDADIQRQNLIARRDNRVRIELVGLRCGGEDLSNADENVRHL